VTTYDLQDRRWESWGNSIRWLFGQEGTKVVGWMSPKPKVDDEVTTLMESGKVGRYRITEVEHPGDPKDMFFAKVEFVGYADDGESS
jgi:hypothetical protein